MKKNPGKFLYVQEYTQRISLPMILLFLAFASYGQWTQSRLSEGKVLMGATSLGTKAYFAGGNCGSDGFSEVEIYDVLD